MENKVCKKCGESFPATKEFFRFIKKTGKLEAKCKKCANERSRQLYQERHKEYKREYYANNIDEIKHKRAVFREENRDKLRAIARVYGQLPNVKKRRHERKLANPNQSNESYNRYYRGKGGEKIRAIVQRRDAKKNNAVATLTTEQWLETLESFNNRCVYCGEKLDNPQQEHVVPSSLGGGYTKDNILPACKSCNSSKHNHPLEEWYQKQSCFSPERLAKIHKWTGFNEKTNTQQLGMF